MDTLEFDRPSKPSAPQTLHMASSRESESWKTTQHRALGTEMRAGFRMHLRLCRTGCTLRMHRHGGEPPREFSPLPAANVVVSAAVGPLGRLEE